MVGTVNTNPGGFLYTKGKTYKLLELIVPDAVLPEGVGSMSYLVVAGINDKGQIIGRASCRDLDGQAIGYNEPFILTPVVPLH